MKKKRKINIKDYWNEIQNIEFKDTIDNTLGYLYLAETFLTHILDGMRIKQSWLERDSISKKLYEQKLTDLNNGILWVKSDIGRLFISVYGSATGIDSKKIIKAFKKTYRKSNKFLKNITVVDKNISDNQKIY